MCLLHVQAKVIWIHRVAEKKCGQAFSVKHIKLVTTWVNPVEHLAAKKPEPSLRSGGRAEQI